MLTAWCLGMVVRDAFDSISQTGRLPLVNRRRLSNLDRDG